MNSINHLSSLIDYSVLDEEEVVPIVLYASLTMMSRKQLLLTRVVIIAAPIIVKAIMVQASLVIIVEAIRMPVQTAAAVSMVMISINAVVFLVNPAIHRQGVVVRLWGRRVIVNCMLWVRRRLHIHRCHACVNVAIEIL